MKKYYGIVIWVLIFILTVFLALIIPDTYTDRIWTIIVFDIIAFASQLLLWFSKCKDTKEMFYKYPAMTVSTVYLVLQFIVSTAVSVMNESISFKLVLIINVVLLIVMCALILSALMEKDKIESLDTRQKDHHINL